MNVLLADGPITKSKLPTTKICLPETGFIRLKNIVAPYGPIPLSKSTWWAGVKSKRFPQPIKLGPKITAWRVEDIRALIEKPERSAQSAHLKWLQRIRLGPSRTLHVHVCNRDVAGLLQRNFTRKVK